MLDYFFSLTMSLRQWATTQPYGFEFCVAAGSLARRIADEENQ